MVTLRGCIRLPGCLRWFQSRIGVLLPLGWLLAVLYLLLNLLVTYDRLGRPRLSLDGLYRHGGAIERSEEFLMPLLGFVPNPILYPHAHHVAQDLPVFITTLESDDLHSFHRFLGSFRLYFPDKKLVVYDLGLTKEDVTILRRTCQCLVRPVHWNQYPAHVRDLTLKAYRPLLIQETLQEFGIVFWCHHSMRFNSSEIDPLRSQAESLGLVAWPSQDYPTSTYTHYGTFRYLRADHTQYHFIRMVEPDTALYCNTFRLHYKLLMPLVKCVLDLDCISPQGSQSRSVCDLTHRPRYVYSGCHRYDIAAFNVILGQMFYLDAAYIPATKIFYRELVLPLPGSSVVRKPKGRTKASQRIAQRYWSNKTVPDAQYKSQGKYRT